MDMFLLMKRVMLDDMLRGFNWAACYIHKNSGRSWHFLVGLINVYSRMSNSPIESKKLVSHDVTLTFLIS